MLYRKLKFDYRINLEDTILGDINFVYIHLLINKRLIYHTKFAVQLDTTIEQICKEMKLKIDKEWNLRIYPFIKNKKVRMYRA